VGYNWRLKHFYSKPPLATFDSSADAANHVGNCNWSEYPHSKTADIQNMYIRLIKKSVKGVVAPEGWEQARQNYSAWQNEIAKMSSLLQLILALQVCSVQIVALFTIFEAQKIDKFIETPVSTMALHSGHLIKRRGILFTSLCWFFAV
jgi:hypothetical protein